MANRDTDGTFGFKLKKEIFSYFKILQQGQGKVEKFGDHDRVEVLVNPSLY